MSWIGITVTVLVLTALAVLAFRNVWQQMRGPRRNTPPPRRDEPDNPQPCPPQEHRGATAKKWGKRLWRVTKWIAIIAGAIWLILRITDSVLSPFAPSGYSPFGTSGENVSRPAVSEEAILKAVAECESNDKHFDANGEVIHNTEGSSAAGRYQILESKHGDEASRMGFDLHKEEDNKIYARHLFRENGLKDWEDSRKCWEPKLLALGYREEERTIMVRDSLVVTAEPNKLSPWYEFPVDRDNPYYAQWNALTTDARFAIVDLAGHTHTYTPEGNQDVGPNEVVRKLRLKAIGDRPEQIELTAKRAGK